MIAPRSIIVGAVAAAIATAGVVSAVVVPSSPHVLASDFDYVPPTFPRPPVSFPHPPVSVPHPPSTTPHPPVSFPHPPVSFPRPHGVPTQLLGLFGDLTSRVVAPSTTTTLSGKKGSATATVTVPPGALPSGTTVALEAGNKSSPLRSESLRGTNNVYVTAFSVSWATSSGTSPAATAPITMTIDDPGIKAGDAIYAMTSSGLTRVGTATKNGVATITFTSDPAFVVGSPPRLGVVKRSGVLERKGRDLVYKLRCRSGMRCVGVARLVVVRMGRTHHAHLLTVASGHYSIVRDHHVAVSFAVTGTGHAVVARASGKRLRMSFVTQPKGGRREVMPVYLH